MAGGKETPRQKMIGLMYLVLTAMLALNVDSSVLERFILINETLEQQIAEQTSKNSNMVAGIKSKVEERNNQEEEVKIYETAREVRQRTQKLVEYCNMLKAEIIDNTGGYEDSVAGTIKGAKDMDKIATYMILQGRGDSLKQRINQYAAFLRNVTGDEARFPDLALDGKEHPYYSKIPNQRGKNFKQLLFESTPTAGGLASISQLEARVVNYESEALDILAREVGAQDIRFDNIKPMIVPESKYVAAGTKFKAKMYATASASNVTPDMWYNGNAVSVNAEGVGEFEFPVSGGNYDNEGRIRKTISAKIRINEKEFTDELEYFVVKPTVQIQSASVQALYFNCGNKLFVDVPALGQAYNPNFKASGGKTIEGADKGVVTVVPNSKKVTLAVYSGNTLIDNVEFDVRSIPKPSIILKSGGSPVNLKQGMSQPPRELTLDAVPDDDFASFLPDDARYRVTEWELIWARGSRAIDRRTINGPSTALPSNYRQMRAGDRIVIEVKEVLRKNFQDNTEKVVIGVDSRVKTVPIN